jgi:hypothetical protein
VLGVVRDLRSPHSLADPDQAAAYQEHLLAEFVLARLAHGVADSTIRSELAAVEEFLASAGVWAWEVEPPPRRPVPRPRPARPNPGHPPWQGRRDRLLLPVLGAALPRRAARADPPRRPGRRAVVHGGRHPGCGPARPAGADAAGAIGRVRPAAAVQSRRRSGRCSSSPGQRPRLRPADHRRSGDHQQLLAAVVGYGQARGWSLSTLRRVQHSLAALLASQPTPTWPPEAAASASSSSSGA